MQQGLGLLGGVGLGPRRVLDPLRPRANRNHPVRPHLHIIVGDLHGVIVEGVTRRVLGLGRPDKRLVRIGEPSPLEVRHGVGLAPDDVIENPETEILEGAADAEDVMIAADHP